MGSWLHAKSQTGPRCSQAGRRLGLMRVGVGSGHRVCGPVPTGTAAATAEPVRLTWRVNSSHEEVGETGVLMGFRLLEDLTVFHLTVLQVLQNREGKSQEAVLRRGSRGNRGGAECRPGSEWSVGWLKGDESGGWCASAEAGRCR